MAYTKKTWQKGEVIKATDLNNMETGIEAVTDEVGGFLDNGITMGESSIGVVIHDEGMVNNSVNSIIFGLNTVNNNHTYKTDIDSKCVRVLVFGPVKVTGAKSGSIAIGQMFKGTATLTDVFPYLSDYIDDNLAFQPHLGASASYLAGSCYNFGANSFVHGAACVNTANAGCSMNAGQYNYVDSKMSGAIGEGLITSARGQFCVGLCNDNDSGDAFEVGNGTCDVNVGTISRSNAFRVTKTGDAIAQTSLGIEDGNGSVVTITAEQLQALLTLIPPQYEVKELTSSNRTYSMAAFDDISKLPTPTPYEMQSGGYYLNTESTTVAGLRMDGGVSPSINGAILKVTGGSTVNFNPGALDISYALCEFNESMNQPIGGAGPSTWLTESRTLKDTTAYIGIHFKVNSGEMTDAIRSQLLSTISVVSE